MPPTSLLRLGRAASANGGWLLSACLLAGCGGGGPAVAPVAGVVTFNGQPLAGATVVFRTAEAVEGFGPLVATGITGVDGRFTLLTRVDAKRSLPGAALGGHRVTVSAFVPPDGMTETQYQGLVAAFDENVKTKGHTAAGEPPPPKVSRVKPEFGDARRTPLTAKVEAGSNEFTFAVE
jgi:hypothetical protein